MSAATAAAVALGVGAVGSVVGAGISANAAGNAANTQANAADTAANDQLALGQENLGLQTSIFNADQANEKPFLEAGQNAITRINSLNGQAPLSSAPAASQQPIAAPNLSGAVAPIPRAKGGPVLPYYMQAATRYKVGEKGPEELDMYPNGTGVVIPHDQLMKSRYHPANLIPRVTGGPVGGLSSAGGSGDGNGAGGPPVQTTGSGLLAGNGGNPVPPHQPLPAPANGAAPASSSSSAWSGDPNATADANNPLVSGGSSTPTQNVPFSAWTQQFTAPTAAQAAATPGFQFAEQQGDQALLDQASAAGTTGSSGTAVALDQYNQNLANTNYQQVYNNAMNQYDQNYNIFSNNQANQWNRLASTAGIGQTSAGQLNSAGANLGSSAGSALTSTGAQVGQNLNNAAAAIGSGYVGAANAYGGALGNLSNTASQLPLYMQLMQQNGSNLGYNPDYSLDATAP